MNIQPLKIGSRASPLALVQVEEVRQLFSSKAIDNPLELVKLTTSGDVDKKSSLSTDVSEDFFTDVIDQALLDGQIDLAVHSAKDVPGNLHKDLAIFALTQSADDTDAFVGREDFYKLKKGAKIGTSSTLRTAELIHLNPDLKMVDIRGTIEERIALIDQGVCDGIIVATIALKRLKLEKHIKNIMPWAGFPLQGQLAIVGRRKDVKLKKMISSVDIRQSYGKVLLVGAGPGDPDLITVKGVNALKNCDCVLYDYLVDQELLKYAPKAEHIYVGKRKGIHSLKQKELSILLKNKALEGKNVVRLKGGDPLIFGRGNDEIEFLKAYHIDVEVIPGITSATGILSGLAVPLTARGVSSSVGFVSAHVGNENQSNASAIKIPDTQTIVFFMGLTKLPQILEALKKKGWSDEKLMMAVSKGSRKDERVIIAKISEFQEKVEQANLEQPVLLIAGDVLKFYQPKNEEKVVFTGTNPRVYSSLGEIVHLPMIAIKTNTIPLELQKQLLESMNQYDLILLTSRFAVIYFFEWLNSQNVNVKDYPKIKFACIGSVTENELKDRGFEADLVAEDSTSKGFVKALDEKYLLDGMRILFPRSNLSNPYIKEQLLRKKAKVDEVAIYQNCETERMECDFEAMDKIIFTSPSTVERFLKKYTSIPQHLRIMAKGQTTKDYLKTKGYASEVCVYD